MIQSNMVCFALAFIMVTNIGSQPTLCILSTLILALDALLGAAIFVAKHEKEIKNSFTFVRKFRGFNTMSKASQLNISYVDDSFGSII